MLTISKLRVNTSTFIALILCILFVSCFLLIYIISFIFLIDCCFKSAYLTFILIVICAIDNKFSAIFVYMFVLYVHFSILFILFN